MSARDKILSRIKSNQSAVDLRDDVRITPTTFPDAVVKFTEMLVSIGGAAIEIEDEDEIAHQLLKILPAKVGGHRVDLNQSSDAKNDPHAYSNTDVAILRGEFGVAENGSVWITDAQMIDRALPFICLHLVLVIRKSSIVQTMHDAYDRIGNSTHEFGTFIAGPSKTADIEQSLVLGAHGAKTLICFIVK